MFDIVVADTLECLNCCNNFQLKLAFSQNLCAGELKKVCASREKLHWKFKFPSKVQVSVTFCNIGKKVG